MARCTTKFIIETTGGAPVFHIPFPISALGALAGVDPRGGSGSVSATGKGSHRESGDRGQREMPNVDEDVQFIFRNKGGTPTFHVGGADIGVCAADAWDLTRVVRAVMRGRAAAEGDVTVKVEEGTAGVPLEEPVEETRTCPYSREELAAIARGSLTRATFAAVYAEGRADFALQCDPASPPDRALSAAEEREWRVLWEALLHLDRVFTGPLRDNVALKRRSDRMIEAAARRAHARAGAATGADTDSANAGAAGANDGAVRGSGSVKSETVSVRAGSVRDERAIEDGNPHDDDDDDNAHGTGTGTGTPSYEALAPMREPLRRALQAIQDPSADVTAGAGGAEWTTRPAAWTSSGAGVPLRGSQKETKAMKSGRERAAKAKERAVKERGIAEKEMETQQGKGKGKGK
ncbi:hypothetical protein DFH09DRAFT_1151069, partial [Mycena vulgaris]